jgi:hypothetical protein
MPDLVAALLVTAVALLTLWYADACRRGTVRRQRILGYRTRLTMRDLQAWISVHKAMAPLLFVASVGALIGGLSGMVLVALGATAGLPAVLGGALAWLLLGVLASAIPGSAAARDYRRSADDAVRQE